MEGSRYEATREGKRSLISANTSRNKKSKDFGVVWTPSLLYSGFIVLVHPAVGTAGAAATIPVASEGIPVRGPRTQPFSNVHDSESTEIDPAFNHTLIRCFLAKHYARLMVAKHCLSMEDFSVGGFR